MTWLYGMTTLEEQAFCRDYAAHSLTGTGEVVDLGCWLGSATLALVQGLDQNPHAAARGRLVHAYDRFRWQEWMDPIAHGIAERYAPGDSFVDEFERRVHGWRHRIEVHQEDLTDTIWSGGPIEFLFVDAMKNPELTLAIAREFFPPLLPDAVVVHQDYVYPWCPWIHLLMFRLRHSFEPFAAIRNSYGAAFRTVGQVQRVEVEAACSGRWSNEEIIEAFAHASTLADESRLPRLWAAKLVALVLAGDREAFEEELADPRVLSSVSLDPDGATALAWCRARLLDSL
jgi:hypothetical protein